MERVGSFIDDDERLTGNRIQELGRKRTLVRPERQQINPDHPQYHYTQAAAQPHAGVTVMPSTTGNEPVMGAQDMDELEEFGLVQDDLEPAAAAPAPDTDSQEQPRQRPKPIMGRQRKTSLWHIYCRILTFPILPWMMRPFGMKTKERQMAWREKIGLISIVLLCMAFIGYITFGFTETVCHNDTVRVQVGYVTTDQVVISGYTVGAGSFDHPATSIFAHGTVLYDPVNCGGKDLTMLFQNVNGKCLDVITPKDGTSIPTDGKKMGWYFPCRVIDSQGNWEDPSNYTTVAVDLYDGFACHTSDNARSTLYGSGNVSAQVYYKWEDIRNDTRQLVVYNGDIINMDYITHLLTDDVEYPATWDKLASSEVFRHQDISQLFSSGHRRRELECLRQIAKVGVLDTEEIGCIASSVVLYISLVFILGLVFIKFVLAVYFHYVLSRKQGAFPVTIKEMIHQENEVEDWTADPYRQAPLPPAKVANKRKSLFQQRLSKAHNLNNKSKRTTMVTQHPVLTTSKVMPANSVMNMSMGNRNSVFAPSMLGGRPKSQYYRDSTMLDTDTSYKRHSMPLDSNQSTLSIPTTNYNRQSTLSSSPSPHPEGERDDSEEDVDDDGMAMSMMGPVGGDDEYWVPQPPVDYEPFGFPLAHIMCLVTAYSEDEHGLRTTLDSIATTEYPNSHKLITIICDGLIKGSGNDKTTPEICLDMMYDFHTPPEDVQPYSYVSVVAGAKRHNMAKVYAGFYKYNDSTVPRDKQQRVPVILVSKCGTPAEASNAKPGNRGKRDSQVILMSFLQRVMFDDRMTELEFELFNGICNITGIAPDYYEMMLMVDADTRVFPDCLTHMAAEMVKDPEIMGLCGETKISNKTQNWVTAIQVFEYFISHHQAKAFESVFGNVTCLPGCFSIYRIKSPKGQEGYWVPILANPDIVERYSENNVETLHEKNLLLLGEDRYLSTLMLRTFPKRKNVFLPRAACKTVVPDSFMVLLSQRRRWINSTIHNLFELLLVRDLCGVFIISMQFVIAVDLISTLVLPAAIAFTLYVIGKAVTDAKQSEMSLILLAFVLGLPGVLVIVTASRVSYLLWLCVYLLALPIWNFVLPVYAYWKFDDFSWGDTRKIAGGDKEGHGDAAGEFDSSKITMKRWREFQRDREMDY